MKRGRGARPLLKSEILEAQDQSRSAAEAARKLDVSYNTYKKWARQYGIFDRLKNQAGVGIRKTSMTGGAVPLEDVVVHGKHPKYSHSKLQKRLIRDGVFEEKCSNCGFDEKRITDLQVPLKLNHINGDGTDHRLENLELVCYNCWFLTIGNLWGRNPGNAGR